MISFKDLPRRSETQLHIVVPLIIDAISPHPQIPNSQTGSDVCCTEDVEKRLAAHNSGKVKSTRNRKPMKLIYVEEQASRSAAFCREKYLKSIEGLKEKKRIIEEFDRRV